MGNLPPLQTPWLTAIPPPNPDAAAMAYMSAFTPPPQATAPIKPPGSTGMPPNVYPQFNSLPNSQAPGTSISSGAAPGYTNIAQPPPASGGAAPTDTTPTAATPDEAYAQFLKDQRSFDDMLAKPPQYQAPNKWVALGTALLGAAFPGSPFSKAMAGFDVGLQSGAQQKYEQQEEQYQTRLGAEERRVGQDVTWMDTQERIKAQAQYQAARLQIDQERVAIAQKRADDLWKGTVAHLGIDQERIKALWASINERYYAVTQTNMRSANQINSHLYGIMLQQVGANSRTSAEIGERTYVSNVGNAAKQYNAEYDAQMKALQARTDIDDSQKGAIAQKIEAQYDTRIQTLLGNSRPGPVRSVADYAAALDSQGVQDDEEFASSLASGGYSGISPYFGGYGYGGGYGMAPTAMPPIGAPGTPGGLNNPAEAQGAYPQQGGYYGVGNPISDPNYSWAGQRPYAQPNQGQPPPPPAAKPPAAAPPSPQHQAMVSGLEHTAAAAGLGRGPGVSAPGAFGQMKEAVSQLAERFPTQQSLLAAMGKWPEAAQLSAAQVAELMEVWQRTHQGQGKPVAAAPAPPAATMSGPPAPPQESAAQRAYEIGQQGGPPPIGGGLQDLANSPVGQAVGEGVRELGNEVAGFVGPGVMGNIAAANAVRGNAPIPSGGGGGMIAGAQEGARELAQEAAGFAGPRVTANVAAANAVRGGQPIPGTPYAQQVYPQPQPYGALANVTTFQIAERAAREWGVPPALVLAVIQNESHGSRTATSPTGARSYMQLEPGTAKELGVSDITDPVQNITGGTRYLRGLLDRFHSIPAALAAYNMGPHGFEQNHFRPVPETASYVAAVMADYARLLRWLPISSTSQAASNF